MESNAPIVPATLFGAAWAGVSYAPLNYRLPEAQLEALLGRIEPAVVVGAALARQQGHRATAPFPDAPDAPRCCSSPAARRPSRRPRCSSTTSCSPTSSTRSSSRRRVRTKPPSWSVPPFHIAGVAAVLSNTYVGRRIVPVPGVRFSAEDWLVTARDEGVTHAMLVPTMLGTHRRGHGGRRVAAGPDACATLVVRRRPMPPPSSSGRCALFPEVDFVNAYGLTETSSTVAILGPDDHRLAALQRRAAVHGPPRRRSASRCRASRSASSTSRAERSARTSPARSTSAATRSAASTSAPTRKVDADGWLHTGDRGWLDIEGYLFCEGRADDTIIRGGENIGPAEIEDALLQHDAISIAAVVGLPDERVGREDRGDDLAAGRRRRGRPRPRPRLGPRAHRLTQDPRDHRGGRGGPADRHRQAPPPRGQAPHSKRTNADSALDRRRPTGWAFTSPVTSSSRSGWPFRVPSRNAIVIVLGELERGVARLRVRRHVARVQE